MHHIMLFGDVQNIVSIVCPNRFIKPSSYLGLVLVRLSTIWILSCIAQKNPREGFSPPNFRENKEFTLHHHPTPQVVLTAPPNILCNFLNYLYIGGIITLS